MNRIFISYKRADKDIVFPIKDKIEAAIGEKCWIDLAGIESDAQFVEVIMRAIDAAEVVLFMYSKSHTFITNFKTDWTVREINYAQEEGKSIVFVNIDGTPLSKWFKFMFPQQQQVDATSSWALTKLIEEIKSKLGKKTLENFNHVVASSVTDFASSFHSYTEDLDYDYNEIKHTATVDKHWGRKYYHSNINIPPIVKKGKTNYQVTGIDSYTFDESKELRSVQIPHTVTSIGECVFSDCINLEYITLPEKITSIRERVFSGCKSLRIINLPDSIKSIGHSAFSGCHSLQRIDIPKDVNLIGGYAFSNCTHLESITLPKKITSIREGVFSKCESLSSIIIPEGITYIGESAFEACVNLISVTFPPSIRRIGKCAFKGCTNLKTIVLQKDITDIGEDAFPSSCEIIRE